MSDTEHDSFSSEMVNQDRNTVFTHTTLSHSVHTSQGHILPLSGVTCKDNATHKYTVVNFKLGKPIISLRIHLSFYYYSLTEKSCKESEYFEFEFQVVRIWCISFEFSKNIFKSKLQIKWTVLQTLIIIPPHFYSVQVFYH